MISFPWEHISYFESTRLFFLFPLCNARFQGRRRYCYLGKFQISLVEREVIDPETKCGRMLMFDTVWERLTTHKNLGKIQVPQAGVKPVTL